LSHATRLNIDVNSQGTSGKTLLHYSFYYGCPLATDFLLKYDDLDVNIPDSTGKTPVHWAFVDDALNVEDRGYRTDHDVLIGRLECARLLLEDPEKSKDINFFEVDNTGRHAYHMAVICHAERIKEYKRTRTIEDEQRALDAQELFEKVYAVVDVVKIFFST
jgi:ankyrin repeat protein